ncbi:MAG: PIN domain-containing protein [bacterium]|nr:PIN domain-containing protein [bacterium]
MIYLDTHVVAWLYGGHIESLSLTARNLINENDLYISPIVILELQYLLEIERITQSPQTVVSTLSTSIGLHVCGKDFQQIVLCAGHFSWTRDPFDRIIVAHAALNNNTLLTKDRTLLTHFEHAVW